MRNPLRLLLEEPAYIFGRFQTVRLAYGHAQAILQAIEPKSTLLKISEHYGETFTPLCINQSDLVASDVTSDHHLRNLSTYSFSSGLELSPGAAGDLIQAAQVRALKGVHVRDITYEQLPRLPHVREREAILSVIETADLETVRALAGDQFLFSVVSGHLGYRPARVSSWLFWSLENDLQFSERERLNQTIRFHYDVDGFNFVYVNFYLTNTSESSGAHVLIESTHNNKTLSQLFGSARIDDEQALKRYGRDRIKVVEGPVGYGFFEDASCYHKALPPRSGDRLMLQFRYQ